MFFSQSSISILWLNFFFFASLKTTFFLQVSSFLPNLFSSLRKQSPAIWTFGLYLSLEAGLGGLLFCGFQFFWVSKLTGGPAFWMWLAPFCFLQSCSWLVGPLAASIASGISLWAGHTPDYSLPAWNLWFRLMGVWRSQRFLSVPLCPAVLYQRNSLFLRKQASQDSQRLGPEWGSDLSSLNPGLYYQSPNCRPSPLPKFYRQCFHFPKSLRSPDSVTRDSVFSLTAQHPLFPDPKPLTPCPHDSPPCRTLLLGLLSPSFVFVRQCVLKILCNVSQWLRRELKTQVHLPSLDWSLPVLFRGSSHRKLIPAQKWHRSPNISRKYTRSGSFIISGEKHCYSFKRTLSTGCRGGTVSTSIRTWVWIPTTHIKSQVPQYMAVVPWWAEMGTILELGLAS